MNLYKMYVIKASGKRQRFDPSKIKETLQRAGASEKVAEEVVKKVRSRISDGTKTEKILSLALKLLKNKTPEIASIYNLKKAIMQLGPTGFPFEKYFAKILKEHGYKVKVGRVVRGKLASHEIDISANKNKRYLIECKYHNDLGIYTGMKTALYVYARFLDLKGNFDQAWLATNTKFSNNVVEYSKGVNIKLTGWRFPKEENLQELIESKKLYPITILNTIDKTIRGKLFKKNLVTLKDLLKYSSSDLKRKTKIPEEKLIKILDEAKRISKAKN